MPKYLKNIGIALSQLWNTFCGGMPDETICARAWRSHMKGRWTGTAFVAVVNAFFFWQSNHCKSAYIMELDRAHVPSEIKEAQALRD